MVADSKACLTKGAVSANILLFCIILIWRVIGAEFRIIISISSVPRIFIRSPIISNRVSEKSLPERYTATSMSLSGVILPFAELPNR